MGVAALLLVCGAAGCHTSERQPDASLERLPASNGLGAPKAPRAEVLSDTTTARASCVPPESHVALTGVLEQEVHFGAPNYGETPEQDSRDSITVVVLPVPLLVCDSGTGDAADTLLHVQRIQIMGIGPSWNARLRHQATVYGSLKPAAFGFHYTRVVVYMDSVVAPGPRTRPELT